MSIRIGETGTVNHRTLKSGRFQSRVQARLHTGHLITVTASGDTQADSDQALQDKLDLVLHRGRGEKLSPTMLLSSWVSHWETEFLEEDRKPATIDLYRSILKTRVLPNIEGIRLTDMTHLWARAWLKTVTAGYAPDTAKQTKSVVHKVMADAVAYDLIPTNPFHDVVVPGSKKSRKGARDRFSPQQMVEIVTDLRAWTAAATTTRHRSRIRLMHAVIIYAVAAQRRSELLGATIADLSWEDDTVTINITTQADAHGKIVDLKTDESGHRTVTISDPLACQILRERSQGKTADQFC